MANGNSKKRGFMLARCGRSIQLPLHTAPSGGEKQVARGRRLSVNLQGATLGIPANWQPDVLLGTSQDGPHVTEHIIVAGSHMSAARGLTAAALLEKQMCSKSPRS